MIALKGRYDGITITFDKPPAIHECDVIVTFLDTPTSKESIEPQPSPKGIASTMRGSPLDDGSLEYLFRDYKDDSIREPIVDFGNAVGNEQW
jgi:hypothetical protein